MEKSAIWTPYAILILGCWLASSSVSHTYASAASQTNDLIAGTLLILAGLFSRRQRNPFLPWAIGLLGIWLQIAPLVFWANSTTYTNDTLTGILAILFAVVIPPLPRQTADTGPSVPPGFSFNPASWAQRLPIAALAILGWLFSRYLAAYQLGYIATVWDPAFPNGTENVLTSDLSQQFPVSDAGLGAAAYAIEALLTCQGGERRWRTSPWMVVTFGILVIPTGLISSILILSQPLVVGSWCFLCLITALCSLLPIPLAIDEVAAVIAYLKIPDRQPFWKRFFCGGNAPGATEDHRTPLPEAPLRQLLKASLWGVSLPWNLSLSALLGALVLFFPTWLGEENLAASLASICGALIAVNSVIALSELARPCRFLNLLPAAALAALAFLGAWQNPLAFPAHLAAAILAAALAFRKGPLRETFSR